MELDEEGDFTFSRSDSLTNWTYLYNPSDLEYDDAQMQIKSGVGKLLSVWNLEVSLVLSVFKLT